MNTTIDYSAFNQERKTAFERFGSIYNLTIIESVYDFLKKSYHSGNLLDVGAGIEHYIKKVLKLDDRVYSSLDNDPGGSFTYQKVSDIPKDKVFQWIVINQMLEHLTIPQAHELMVGLQAHLQRRGTMAISVPNVFHPVRYWSTPFHLTPWSYTDLYSLTTICGFQVIQIYRYSKNSAPRDPITWVLERLIRRLYRIDWCDSILLIATR